MIELPNNWDQLESEHYRQFDPYDEDLKCEDCGEIGECCECEPEIGEGEL